MKVICARIGKTGTTSTAKALRHLGFTVFDWEEQTFYFLDHLVDVFQTGAELDAKRVYQNVDAIVDYPGNYFWEEILKAFPDSKVILSVREEDSWVKRLASQLEVTFASRFHKMSMLSPTARNWYSVLDSYVWLS